jgi:phosphoglycerate dehydrogenase-like enzyme
MMRPECNHQNEEWGMTMRIAILDDYQNLAHSSGDWSSLGKDVEIVERLADFEIICAMRERTPFSKSLLAKLPNLKLLISSGMRNRGIDAQAAKAQGVVVCGTPSVGRPTADLAWGLILGLARQIPQEDRNVRAGGWQRTVGMSLEGRTLGIAGLGNLGGRMAIIAKAFGMNVIAWSQNLTHERCDELAVEKVSKEDLLKRSDFITVHLILSNRSRGLFGAVELALMKPTAYMVNTARGPIIDEDALASALEDGTIAGAGIDVFSVEPLPLDHPFRRLENIIVTPHLGYVSDQNYQAYFGGYVEAIQAFLTGEPKNFLGGY